MKLLWRAGASVLLLAQFGMAMRSPGDYYPNLWPKPKVSSPPNSLAYDPRYPDVYDTWRFRYTCQ
jgi:hypothetical protein